MQLAQARRLRQNGDHPAAIASFDAFLAAYPHHPLAATARLELAQTWLAAGQPQQAIPILESLAADEAALAGHPEILYWLGRVYQPFDLDKAARYYLQYADASPHLRADAALDAAGAWLANQDPDSATRAYQRALDEASNLVTTLRAREGLAQAAMMAGNVAEAIVQYQRILGKAQSPAYRAEIFYRLGQAQEAAGRQQDAWESYRQATTTAPDSWSAYQALIRLVNAEQAVAPRLRARIDIHAGAYLPAIAVLDQLLAEEPDDAAALWALLARAYEGLENYAAAADAWRQALANPADDAARDQAWLGLGRSLWRQGLREQARTAYLQAAEQASDPDVAATALWWAAVLAGQDNAKWEQAADDFMRLARSFPDSDYAGQAGFRAGLIHYRLGDDETARSLWTEHVASGDGAWQAAAHFWLGKLLQRAGREEEALAHWRETARRWDENTFYGVRSRQKLQAAGIALIATPPPAHADDLQAAAAWTADLAGEDASAVDRTPPDFARVEELHRIGKDGRGHRELEALRGQWQDDPVKLLQLALFARDIGYYDASIRAALRLVALSGQPLTAAPRYVQKLAYPLYYRDIMLDAARTYHLDPALFYALIRQESLFWAPATSFAGARGLAQIMPDTGQSAAAQLQMQDFDLSDLNRPNISLMLGAYLLSDELRRSEGDVFRSLAAYNAGPGNAAFWWDLAENDPDLFVELISFRETQRYVRTITTQANHYRRLYPDLR